MLSRTLFMLVWLCALGAGAPTAHLSLEGALTQFMLGQVMVLDNNNFGRFPVPPRSEAEPSSASEEEEAEEKQKADEEKEQKQKAGAERVGRFRIKEVAKATTEEPEEPLNEDERRWYETDWSTDKNTWYMFSDTRDFADTHGASMNPPEVRLPPQGFLARKYRKTPAPIR